VRRVAENPTSENVAARDRLRTSILMGIAYKIMAEDAYQERTHGRRTP
jgi:hypothetical protein